MHHPSPLAILPRRSSQTLGKEAWARSTARPKPQIRDRSGASAPSTAIGLGQARQNYAEMKQRFFDFLQDLAEDDVEIPSDQKAQEDLFFQSLQQQLPEAPLGSRKEIIQQLIRAQDTNLTDSQEAISGDFLFDMLCEFPSAPPPPTDTDDAASSAGPEEVELPSRTRLQGPPPVKPRGNRASIRFISDLAQQLDVHKEPSSYESPPAAEAHGEADCSSTSSSVSGSTNDDYDSLSYALCVYSYDAIRADEISICRDDFVRVISTSTASQNWWLVELRGKQGIAPSNYLQMVDSLPSGEVATALFAHQPSDNATGRYLEFDAGDIIQIIREEDSGWCFGYSDFHQGLVPKALLYTPDPSDPISKAPSDEPKNVRQSIFAMQPLVPQAATAAGSSLVLKSAEEELAELILALDAPTIARVVQAIDIASVENLAKNLTKILVSVNRGYDVLECLIASEIERTSSVGTLFRSNSVASHFMVQLARLYCADYFRLVLFPDRKSVV